MKKILLLLVSHGLALVSGVALGIYLLPILTAAPPPDGATLAAARDAARYTARVRRDLAGSDALHWGEGELSVGAGKIAFTGKLAPGPDYRLYLVREFVETEQDFLAIKDSALEVGPVRGFDGFVLPLPPGTEPDAYSAVVIWCEAFSQFITAAAYR